MRRGASGQESESKRKEVIPISNIHAYAQVLLNALQEIREITASRKEGDLSPLVAIVDIEGVIDGIADMLDELET